MLHDLNATLVIAVIIVPTWWLFHGSSWCFTSLRFKDPGSDTTCSDAEGQDSKTWKCLSWRERLLQTATCPTLVVRHALPSCMRCQRSRTPTDFEQNSDGESGGGEQWGSDLIDSAAVHLEIKLLHASCGKAWHNVVWGTIGATLGRYEVFVAEGAPMPSIAQRDKYVSGVPRWECHGRVGIPQSISVMNSCQGCRPVPGGMRLTLRRAEDRKHFVQINCVATVVVRIMTS